ncbi:unnamed protein product [Cuscuta epithymum]|uniref:Uncharacterized protein n=1 Tax=Cuscuta epithymum TaxID=186058 RepID=A0AAV0FNB7_9ASTE|nr:unnamed protein product [Cuscuta epithymum]
MTKHETSGAREGESTNIQKASRPERTLFVQSENHLFVIKIGNGIQSNCSVMKLPYHLMGMFELESKMFLLGGKEFDVAPREIYEVKQDSNNSVSLVPSSVVPEMNDGKGTAIVQKFGSKIFALHMGPDFQYDKPSGRYTSKVFEVFDSAFPEKGWAVKSGIPFFHGALSEGGYALLRFFRVGENLYLDVRGKPRGVYVFNLKTEEWSKDDPFFWGRHNPIGSPLRAVSAPGLDDETYVVFGSHFRAALFTQGKGCSCYQDVDAIFNLEGLDREYMSFQFVETGKGDYLGLLSAQDENTQDFYLLISTFSLEVLTAQVPPIPSPGEPIKMTFLSINRKNQQKLNITGARFHYFAGAACL